MEIINEIEKKHNQIKFKNKNLIICCGMKVSKSTDKIDFYELESSKSIDEFEYYYDYKFYDMRVLERIYVSKKNKCLSS